MASPTVAAAPPQPANINDGVLQHLLVPFVLQDGDLGDPAFTNVSDVEATKAKIQAKLQSLNFSPWVIHQTLTGPLFANANSSELLSSLKPLSAISICDGYGSEVCRAAALQIVAYCRQQEAASANT